MPVITYRGDRFSSAYGASLITAAGLSDLVADTPEAFANIAAALGSNTTRLCELRTNLRAMIRQHGFGDPVRFVRKIENAYLDMLSQKCGHSVSVAATHEQPAAIPRAITT